jgi:glycosyltransferase involved in cell wall biosynthesis
MYTVTLIFRKVQPAFFSIEKVFSILFPKTQNDIKYNHFELPRFTSGLKAIIQNILSVRNITSDIYHITGDVHYVVAGLPASRTILTIHDCVFLHNYSGIKRVFLKWLLLDMPVKRAKIITTISEATKKEILKNTNCTPGKVFVIPNPVDDSICFTEKEFDHLCPVILFIGITANKNLERCIQALQNIPGLLHIIGKITTEQINLLNFYNIKYKIEYGLTDPELAHVFSSCDFVLFPSTFEGFGLPIIEGQKAGRVIITSSLSPMKEVAGEGALFVDPYNVDSIRNGIKEVINNAFLRSELIKKGIINIEKYTASSVSEKYKVLYQLIANQN